MVTQQPSQPLRIALTLAAVVAGGSVAEAAPGEHIRTGDAEIIPKVSFGFQHEINPWHAQTIDPSKQATNVRLIPGLDLRLDGADLDASFGVAYEAKKYFQSDAQNLDAFDAFQVAGSLDALQNSVIGIRITEGAGRKNTPLPAEFSNQPFAVHTRNSTNLDVVLRPGQAFEATLGGAFQLDDYAFPFGASTVATRAYNTRYTVGPQASVGWKFFPRTALVMQGGYDLSRSNNASGDPAIQQASTRAWRVDGGLRGRVTDKLVLQFLGGYGALDADEASVTDPAYAVDVTGLGHLLVDVQARYAMSDDDAAIVGFERDFQTSAVASYIAYDKVYVGVDARVLDRVGLNADFGVRDERIFGHPSITKSDILVTLAGDGTYYLRDYASVTLGATWLRRATAYDDIDIHLLGTFTY